MLKLMQWGIVLVTVVVAGAAQASPTTWNFTGVVLADGNGGPTGQTISGSLTIDLTALYVQYSDGVTDNWREGTFYNPLDCPGCTPQQSSPLQVSGQYFDGNQQVSVGRGEIIDAGYSVLRRNDPNNANGNQYFLQGYSRDTEGRGRSIAISIFDTLGVASQIYTDPNGGLDVTQAINWFAPGATTFFIAYDCNSITSTCLVYQEGTLISVSVLSVPEPTTLALIGLALSGLACIRRRKRR